MDEEYKTTAVLTIWNAWQMTAQNREKIVEWLHRQAFDLSKDGARYSNRFRARYLQPQRQKKAGDG